ncbi:MAG: holo-ACP synthase [Thermodesulfovibrionales bacterium]|nr:holo-ACP synthase [Thermodesulfovibrionales bacterium]
MIYGVGIDLVRIERMKDVVEKWDRKFLERVFTKTEISYCYEKKNPYLSLAVRFAAKEALIKAIGSEVVVPLTDIEVISSESGKPVIKTNGKLKRFFEEKAIKQALISLSHEKDYGIACVVLEI